MKKINTVIKNWTKMIYSTDYIQNNLRNYYLGVKINNYSYAINDFLPINSILTLSNNINCLGVVISSC